MPYETFKHLNPKKLMAFFEGYRLKRMMRDEEAWMQGRYNLEAFMVALSHFGAGLAKKRSNAKYFEKPFMHEDKTDTVSNKESREEVAVFEMKQRIRLLQQQGLPESPI